MKNLRETTRRSTAMPLKEVIEDFMRMYKLKHRYSETYIVNFWEKIVGKTISNRTGKLYVSEGKLFVEITSAPLRQELLIAKSKLVELIRREMPDAGVEDIVFL